jgi:hypothetical protein
MANTASYNEYEIKDGKLFLHSPRATQLAKSVEDSAKEIDAALFYKRGWVKNLKTYMRKLSQ